MTLVSSDNKRYIDIGSDAVWLSVLYTAELLPSNTISKIPLAMELLYNRMCSHRVALETARQINLLRDAFSQMQPDCAIVEKKGEYFSKIQKSNLSPVTTSCANLYITSDGKDLLFELVCILTYAFYVKVDIFSPN